MKKSIFLSLWLACIVCTFAQKSQLFEISRDTSFLEVKVFPNPAQQFALISFSNPQSFPHHLYIVDVHGKVVRTYGDIRQEEVRISLTDLGRGLYFFELRGKRSFYGRLMVE